MGFIASTYTAPYLAAHQQVVRDERVHVDLGGQLRQQLGDAVRLALGRRHAAAQVEIEAKFVK